MLPSSIAKEDVERLRGTGVATTHKMTNEKGEWTGASAVGRAKTVKDYGKSLRNGKEKVKKLLRKASKAHNENRYTDTLHIAVGTDYMYREQKNRINGRTRSKTYEGKGVANDFDRTTREWKKNEENNKKYEPIYQAHKAYHKASVATKKGALTVKRLLKKWSSKK